MADLTATVDAHLEAYGETDPDRRRELIALAWRDDGRLIDPPMDASGHDGIHTMLGQVQGQFPGATFRRTSAVDGHHGYARYGWELVADSKVVLAGTDIVHTGDDGRLATVLGFFGDLTTT